MKASRSLPYHTTTTTATAAYARPALLAASLALLAGSAAAPALAQDDFPSETIQVVTHSGVGGGTDVNARMIIQEVVRRVGAIV